MIVKIDHPHAITCWKTVGVKPNGDLAVVLVVETDLVLDHDRPGYDGKAEASLAKVVVDYMANHNEYDRAAFHSLPDAKTDLEEAKKNATRT